MRRRLSCCHGPRPLYAAGAQGLRLRRHKVAGGRQRAVVLLTTTLVLWCSVQAHAHSVTSTDWTVHYNWPDQNTSFTTSGTADEWSIRQALLERIDTLASNDVATLATFTFSGNSDCCGAAGPILNSVSDALDRGAQVRFIADSDVPTTTIFGGTHSLASLAARPQNPLVLVEDDSAFGIMHHKFGLFDYGPTNQWVLTGSWNFTGGASTYQWNIAIELRNSTLYTAYLTEAEELLAGRFHDDPEKSHAHDGQTFDAAGSWGTHHVRFAPYPSSADGGDNALRDISNAIAQAEQEVVFCLNRLTRESVRDALVAAADRGISVYGVMPRSDTDPGETSHEIYAYLTNTVHYATTNVVHMVPAFSKADNTATDSGETDLVHAKYMVIDPFGSRPLLIHGSANWSFSALASTDSNDENLLFLRHRDIARVFYRHFKRVTGLFTGRPDFWCKTAGSPGLPAVELWVTDTNTFMLESSPAVATGWSDWQTNILGNATRRVLPITNADDVRFFRAGRAP